VQTAHSFDAGSGPQPVGLCGHRVIGANGAPTGFSSGIEIERCLLAQDALRWPEGLRGHQVRQGSADSDASRFRWLLSCAADALRRGLGARWCAAGAPYDEATHARQADSKLKHFMRRGRTLRSVV
jgi:hypothetical protein